MKKSVTIAIAIAIAIIVSGVVYFILNENTMKNTILPSQQVTGKPKNYTISLSESVGASTNP